MPVSRHALRALFVVPVVIGAGVGGEALAQSAAGGQSATGAAAVSPFGPLGEDAARRLAESKKAWVAKWPKLPKVGSVKLERPSQASLDASHRRWAGRQSSRTVLRLAAQQAPALAASDVLVPPADEIDQALGPYALALKNGGAVLSDVPLATPTTASSRGEKRRAAGAGVRWRPADLRWRVEEDSGRFVARRALAEVSVPASAGGTFRVGQFRMRLGIGSGAARGVVSDDAPEQVVFPSVDADTASGDGAVDLVVRALAHGYRYGLVVREPTAPRSWSTTFEGLPDDYRVRRIPDTLGEVAILDEDDRPVGRISAPVGVDADGRPVQVGVTVDGDVVRYRITTDLDDVRLPITIDPQPEFDPARITYDWAGGGTADTSGWNWMVFRGGTTPFTPVSQMSAGNLNGLWMHGATAAWGTYLQYDYGAWVKYPPADTRVGLPGASGEHAFWFAHDTVFDYGMVPSQWFHAFGDPGPSVGFWSDANLQMQPDQYHRTFTGSTPNGEAGGGWASDRATVTSLTGARIRGYVGAGGWNGEQPVVLDENQQRPGNIYDWGLVDAGAYSTFQRPQTWGRIAWVRLYASDKVVPSVVSDPQDPPWKDPSQSVTASARDRGMGVRRFAIETTGGVQQPGTVHEPACPGSGSELCPFDALDVAFSGAPDVVVGESAGFSVLGARGTGRRA